MVEVYLGLGIVILGLGILVCLIEFIVEPKSERSNPDE